MKTLRNTSVTNSWISNLHLVIYKSTKLIGAYPTPPIVFIVHKDSFLSFQNSNTILRQRVVSRHVNRKHPPERQNTGKIMTRFSCQKHRLNRKINKRNFVNNGQDKPIVSWSIVSFNLKKEEREVADGMVNPIHWTASNCAINV